MESILGSLNYIKEENVYRDSKSGEVFTIEALTSVFINANVTFRDILGAALARSVINQNGYDALCAKHAERVDFAASRKMIMFVLRAPVIHWQPKA